MLGCVRNYDLTNIDQNSIHLKMFALVETNFELKCRAIQAAQFHQITQLVCQSEAFNITSLSLALFQITRSGPTCFSHKLKFELLSHRFGM